MFPSMSPLAKRLLSRERSHGGGSGRREGGKEEERRGRIRGWVVLCGAEGQKGSRTRGEGGGGGLVEELIAVVEGGAIVHLEVVDLANLAGEEVGDELADSFIRSKGGGERGMR